MGTMTTDTRVIQSSCGPASTRSFELAVKKASPGLKSANGRQSGRLQGLAVPFSAYVHIMRVILDREGKGIASGRHHGMPGLQRVTSPSPLQTPTMRVLLLN